MRSDLHPTGDILDRYLHGSLSNGELQDVTAHVEECAACRDHLTSSDSFVEAAAYLKTDLDSAAAAEHLDFDGQLAPYVDGQLEAADAEVVESHLAVCDRCANDVQDLRVFRRSLDGEKPRSRLLWIASAAALVIVAGIAAWLTLADRRDAAATREITQRDRPLSTTAARVPAEEAPLAMMRDGGRTITLDRDGRVRGLPGDDPQWEALIANTLRSRSLPIPSLPELRAGRETLLDVSDEPSAAITLLEPVNEVIVGDRPTFRWQARREATFAVEIYDEDFRLVASSGPLRGTSWTPAQSLRRSALHSWQVVASVNGRKSTFPAPPSPAARFRLVSADEAEEIRRARAVTPPSHLILAAVYAKAGLRREAEREVEALAAENPNQRLADDLLRSLRSPSVDRRQ